MKQETKTQWNFNIPPMFKYILTLLRKKTRLQKSHIYFCTRKKKDFAFYFKSVVPISCLVCSELGLAEFSLKYIWT